MGEHLKYCMCIKSHVYDLIVAWDEIEGIAESALINPSNEINYWLIAVVLLTIACLLLLVAIFVKYYMKSILTIP